MSYEIRAIPLPMRSAPGRPAAYPFGSLEVGESFAVPKDEAQQARYAAVKWKARHPGWDYATRGEPDGMRIWRVK